MATTSIKSTLGFGLRWFSVLFLFAGSFAYAMFQGGFVSWFLFYGISVLFLCSSLMPFLSAVGLKVERCLSISEAEAGEEFEVSVTILKPWFVPFFYYEVTDFAPDDVTVDRSDAIFFFSFAKSFTFSYEANVYKRGLYTFNEMVITSNDLFGLLRVKHTKKVETELLVFPPFSYVQNISNIYARSQYAKQLKKGHDEQSFAGIRPYANGDRISRIDWKRSAGVAGLLTKEFEAEQNDQIMILHYPAPIQMKNEDLFEQSIIETASLAATLIQQKAQVTLCSRGSNWMKLFVEEHSWRQGLRILAQTEPTKIGEELPAPPLNVSNGGILFLITPHMTDECMKLVQNYTRQRLIVYTVIASPVAERHKEELKRLGAQPFIPTFSEDKRRRADYA